MSEFFVALGTGHSYSVHPQPIQHRPLLVPPRPRAHSPHSQPAGESHGEVWGKHVGEWPPPTPNSEFKSWKSPKWGDSKIWGPLKSSSPKIIPHYQKQPGLQLFGVPRCQESCCRHELRTTCATIRSSSEPRVFRHIQKKRPRSSTRTATHHGI